jgi:GR25 family glycosyltransferase involved in LPS biosynthesis
LTTTPLQWPTLYRGYFINLDRNARRLAAILDHLKAVGLSGAYQRFAAVDGRAVADQYATTLDPGALGLWLTHEKLLAENAGADAHLHILEDDAILTKNAAVALPALLKHADAKVPDWDLIFTNVLLPLNYGLFTAIQKQWEAFKKTGDILLLNLKDLYLAHCTSVFINKQSIQKYRRLIEGKWSQGIAIDMQHRAQINAGKIKAFTCLPFLSATSIESNDSDIRGELDVSRRVYRIYSRSLFMEADHGQLRRELDQLSQGAKVSPLAEIYLGVLGFSLSDKFEKF